MVSQSINRSGGSRFIPNTIALVFQTVFATLITLAQIKILASFLSKETFGLFASLRGFSFLLATLSANGIPLLLVRFIPVHESNRERREVVRLVATSVLSATVLLIIVSALVQVLQNWTFRFATSDQLTFELYLWFYVTTLGVMLKMILYGALNGLRRLTVQLMLEMLSLLAVLVWIAVARHTLTLPLLFEILGVVNLVTVGVGLPVFVHSLRRDVSLTITGETRREPKVSYRGQYVSYFGWALGLSLVAVAFTDVDRYILVQVVSLELLALFHIGSRISRLANRLIGVANLAFQPEVTRLDVEGRDQSVIQSTWIFLKFNSVIGLLMTMALIVFSGEIIVLVASEQYLPAIPLLVLLAVSLPLTSMTAPLTTVMKARDQVRGALLCDLGWAVSYVSLILVLSPPFGLVGVGSAQLVACLAQLLLALKVSNLPIDARSVGLLVSKLIAAGAVAFMPSVLFGIWVNGRDAGSIGVKLVLFVAGCLVLRWILRVVGLFAADEALMLRQLFERRRIGCFVKLIGFERRQ
ncbi:MAG: lipopolysaccharide biosynthesis protein [Candidatus Latescibacterota bacterium]|nr:MAG: lipopolysaccharide biosynthesis protein [Candidatus Latescibacterota bacterium]